MHVSSKMVFHLSDSFYLGIKNADVVALETNMGTWQEDFSRYDLDAQGIYNNISRWRNGYTSPNDFFTQSTLQFPPYEKMIEAALYNSPSIINNFLYRSYSDKSSDFEEDTYLDLHIYQAGKKWGKKVLGVENFDQSMQLMKEAYLDASKEKDRKTRNFDFDQDFSYAHMEDAYRTGNLDLLDTINKINSVSAAFDEKFLYRRNEIQAASIDSILRSHSTLFVGVGAAHLPGQRGVIELLRKKGYRLRPIKMTERDSRHKDEVEKIRVPVEFSKQTSDDGFFSVKLPGKLYDFNGTTSAPMQLQFSDMSNGSYYMVTRIHANTLLWGHNENVVLRKIDSVIYENVPGKILSKQSIIRNGYKGFEVVNRTRRGDYQRYNIFVTPFEVILFKMSGNAEYVKDGNEADQFFNSIELHTFPTEWKKWSPPYGGFEVEIPHQPVISNDGNWHYTALDPSATTSFEVIRTDVHNYDFVEEDTFDLNLMEESFASNDFIDKQISRKHGSQGGYPSLDVKYKYRDGTVALVKYLIQGTHYYTLVAHAKTENQKMHYFLNSFSIRPFVYPQQQELKDTSLYFTVKSPVPLEKTKKISMIPEGMYRNNDDRDEDAALEEKETYRDRLVVNDSTGEKIYVSFSKPSRYYYYEVDSASEDDDDTTHFTTDRIDWQYRVRKRYELPNKMKVFEYVLGDPSSSRYLHGKLFTKDAVSYRLETEGDTLSRESSFVHDFFETFTPSDTVKGTNPREKKTALFFADFFSKDTMLHKKAVRNVSTVTFDSTDFNQLKKCIQLLTWKERKYMDVKKDFIWELASVKTKASADYLKTLYFAAGDTVDLQYIALKTLLHQQTEYSYKAFKDIMVSDPPVLVSSSGNMTPPMIGFTRTTMPDYSDDDEGNANGFFLDELTDSLQLTRTIFKDLLPLISIDDYEQPMMSLLGTLIDSSLMKAEDYDTYASKFIIEAKQLMKKQTIREKNQSIEMAQKTDDDADEIRPSRTAGNGNAPLDRYATLLLPFWDKNPAVPQLIGQMLKSSDKRLKYNTMLLLLRNNKSIPDTMLKYFAAMDQYRYELYSDLKSINKLDLFPTAFNKQIELAKSKLFMMTDGNYDQPDTIQYIDKLPIKQKEQSGYVFFFRYKQKKDASWKLATVGIIPSDPKKFEYDKQDSYYLDNLYDFTELTGNKIVNDEPLKEQLQKALKKMQYSKRNSAAEFYSEERGGVDFLRD